MAIWSFRDNNNNPLANGKLYTYAAGTTTPLASYTDGSGLTPNTNPIILNSRGEPSNSSGASVGVWIPPGTAYKFVLQDASSNQIWAIDNVLAPIQSVTFTQAYLGSVLYPQTAAESLALVTPTNYIYPAGDLRRYGVTDFSGATDYTAAINAAISVAKTTGSNGSVFHPGGTIGHASTIIVPNGVTIYGTDRNACVFLYSGTGDGWHYSNNGTANPTANTSGYGKVNLYNLKLACTNTANTGAAIEMGAGGYSYFEIHDCWLFGTWKYGVILDAVEICTVRQNIIDLNGTLTAPVGIWFVNGGERISGQTQGFTNVVSITDNQISGANTSGGIGIVDDGGNNHVITGNNVNGFAQLAQFAQCNDLVCLGNSFENVGATTQTAAANVLFTSAGLQGGAKGPTTNGLVKANTFSGGMLAGSCLVFGGANMHQGLMVTGNYFQSVYGRGAAIDVTKLSNSICHNNYDNGSASMAHYTGVHNDNDGNVLYPPQNGSAILVANWGVNGYTFGDARAPFVLGGGFEQKRQTITYSASMSFNLQTGSLFDITATNGTGFTINNPTNASDGTVYTITIRNTSGGSLGTVTWGSAFKLASWTSPATGNSRSITFRVDGSGNSVEISRCAADIPN